MVKAAYSSGKPALGVGAGNTPAIIDTYIANSGLYCFRITIIISASKPIPIILITSAIFPSYSLLFGIAYKSNNVLTVLNNELIC